jgi:hypothetical protein
MGDAFQRQSVWMDYFNSESMTGGITMLDIPDIVGGSFAQTHADTRAFSTGLASENHG